MAKRKIIEINEEKCNGCGQCIPNCPEGALKVIDGKVRLISDLFCDGLGACIKHCPEDAIHVVEREAEPYNEKKVMSNIVKKGKNTIKEHLLHLKNHGENKLLKEAVEYLKENHPEINVPELVHGKEHGHEGGCPGTRMMDMRSGKSEEGRKDGGAAKADKSKENSGHGEPGTGNLLSEIQNWPVQIKLVPVHAPYFDEAELLIAADCVPFAYPKFHQDLLKGKVVLIGCPKLDEADFYAEKLGQIITENNIKSVTVAHMEVPCCFGLLELVKQAIEGSGKSIELKEATIGIKGERIS